MLNLTASVRILLHREPVDFRKAHDGLAALVRQALHANPLDGSLYVFLNRRRDRIKLIQWDGNGLWLHYKRLEKGTFKALTDEPRMTRAQLSMLLEGIEVLRKLFVSSDRRHRRACSSMTANVWLEGGRARAAAFG